MNTPRNLKRFIHGLFQPELGDQTDEAYIANAAITVWVDVDRMLHAWQQELSTK